jgi:hypothetical protein
MANKTRLNALSLEGRGVKNNGNERKMKCSIL